MDEEIRIDSIQLEYMICIEHGDNFKGGQHTIFLPSLLPAGIVKIVIDSILKSEQGWLDEARKEFDNGVQKSG